jgi:hypothetical protein
LVREIEKKNALGTLLGCGVREIDALLGPVGNQVVEISGDKASGKSVCTPSLCTFRIMPDWRKGLSATDSRPSPFFGPTWQCTVDGYNW